MCQFLTMNSFFVGAKAACGAKAGCQDITQANVSYKFGIVMTMAGLLGKWCQLDKSGLNFANLTCQLVKLFQSSDFS